MARRRTIEAERAREASARRARRVEAIALALLAVLPLVPYLTFLLRWGVERFVVTGELARLEQATRHVGQGQTWLGPSTELGWKEPGPLFFFLAAPLEGLSLPKSTGIFLAAALVNAAAAATIVFTTRIFGRRPHAFAALVGVLAWFVAFGDAAAHPASSAVVVLPLMAFLVSAALVARNRSASTGPAFFAAVFGAFAAQTRAAAFPTVVAGALVATVAYVVGARRRGGFTSARSRGLASAAALFLLSFTPTVLEQMTAAPASEGNLARIWRAFAARGGPAPALSMATQHWTTATALLPTRIGLRSLASDGLVPAMLAASEMPHGVTGAARALAFVHVFGATVAAVVAVRRSDLISLALLTLGMLGNVVAVLTLEVGGGVLATPASVFWVVAASTVTWIGILATGLMALGAFAQGRPRLESFGAPTVIVAGLVAAVTATSLQRLWIGKHHVAVPVDLAHAHDLAAVVAAVRASSAGKEKDVVVHRAAAPAWADALLVELEKDGVPVRPAPGDRDLYSGPRHAPVEPPEHTELHVFPSLAEAPIPAEARCLPPIARSGELVVRGYTGDVPPPCSDPP